MSPDYIRSLMDKAATCAPRERDAVTQKLIQALRDPR
jgi:hypothetical protein